ncbi:aminoacyl-tRNA hydrolase [Haloimpatiens lingqiaonensis]|uniref:aminoacyl-tRNA hydrolase n=1 Tax=Haloimpatiens lingqiaonensis TaxID=1380675 RepID=UPI0010FD83F0|nr:aminoacyl-tRNA hydrolase [Haloimpatiens lingqiaonensis]
MYLIIGLGNPGKEYERTRHNLGFEVIDCIGDKYNIQLNRKKFKSICGEGLIGNEKVILMKPQTYMNLSGESLIEAVNFYKIKSDNIIVIYDDISLEVGRIRLRSAGSAGGHNGIKSIIANLNSDKFNRIKVGAGSPKGELVSHVLGKFSKEEREKIEKIIMVAADAAEGIVTKGINEAMNQFNGINL